MALEENGAMNSMVMPVAPMNGGYAGNGGVFGGDGWAWIILLLLLVGNGWNNGNGGGNTAAALYPWMNQADTVNAGFRDQAILGSIDAVNGGVQNLATQMCNGFAGVNATINAGLANNGMAMMQGFNQIDSLVANGSFENRLATANLQSVIQAENCADRTAISDGVRDIIAYQNAGFQSIKDYINQLDSNAKDNEIANLRTQLNMANLAASQGEQTAKILADNTAQTMQLIQRIAPYPTPSWIVQNPYAYSNNGCACGCNA